MFIGLVQKKSRMFTVFSSRHGTTDVHQHGVSILGSSSFA